MGRPGPHWRVVDPGAGRDGPDGDRMVWRPAVRRNVGPAALWFRGGATEPRRMGG